MKRGVWKMHKTLGDAYIPVNTSGLMKCLSVRFTSNYSLLSIPAPFPPPVFLYGHKKSSEWKHREQVRFSTRSSIEWRRTISFRFAITAENFAPIHGAA